MTTSTRWVSGLRNSACTLMLLATLPHAAADWQPPGPAVGSEFPQVSALPDQDAAPRRLQELLGANGAAIFFVRSADWCPFCKRQLLEANAQLDAFRALGLAVISVSKDGVAEVKGFHDSNKIGFTMLADADGAVVAGLGITDPAYGPDSKAHGVPYPILYIVDANLRITHRHAKQSYKERPDLAAVLAELTAARTQAATPGR